jgi:hypothetical protein
MRDHVYIKECSVLLPAEGHNAGHEVALQQLDEAIRSTSWPALWPSAGKRTEHSLM